MQKEVSILLGSASTGRPLDLEALETAVRARALEVAGSVLERALNAEPQEKDAVCPSCKGPARYAGKPSKTFLSLLGNLTLIRSYFLCPACGEGFFPKDRRLGVAETGLTPGVVRMIGLVGAETSFETGSELLSELAGLPVSPKQVERAAEALGAEIAEDEQACPDPDPVAHLPSTLYLGTDGTGIPMRMKELADRPGKQADGSSKTREVKLCVVWSAESTDDEGLPVRDKGSATYSAAIESAASQDTDAKPSDFAVRLLREASRRQFDAVSRQVVIGDGASWIWNIANEHFPKAIQILDLFHAKEHLGTVGKAIFGPESERTLPWIEEREAELDAGHIDAILAALRIYAARIVEAQHAIAYIEKNRHRMRYPEFRAQGLCVGSGVVEAGCKVAIGSRLKKAGMHWTTKGVNAIIALRCCRLSGRFEGFWERRTQRRAA